MAKIGDIFVATWGYDQTNADFFQVIGKTEKSVKVRHIKSKIVEDKPQSMTGYALPIRGSFDGKAMTKRIGEWYGEETFRAGDSMGLAEKWDGKKVRVSWYG